MNAAPVFILLGFVLIFLLWAALFYNNLIRGKNACDESWSDIDTELKRRYNLIPNLVETVKGYAKHEKEVLERVIQLRNAASTRHGSPKAQADDENAFIGSLRQLFAVVENYPELKADQNFLHLQKELAHTEDRIQRARRFYNANVRDLNNKVEVFPSNILAGMFGFQTREFFEIEEAGMREAPEVKV
ncbi:MAG: LemA family protein [Candidatus Omnitrophota bacterium]|jgi:LemA protein|nr:MAG: LemA family protein [Candidatus Omnitrophota bacterium]